MTRSDYVFPVVIHDKLIVLFSNWRVSSFFDKDRKSCGFISYLLLIF